MSRTSQAAVGPQVVIGLTAPSSAPPSDVSIPGAGDLPSGASLRADGVPKLEIVPEAFESNHAIPLVPAHVAKEELDAAAPPAQLTERELDPSPLSEGDDESDDVAPITRRMSDEMVAAAAQEPPADVEDERDEPPAAEVKPAVEATAVLAAEDVPSEPVPAKLAAEAEQEVATATASPEQDESENEAPETSETSDDVKAVASEEPSASIPASDAPVVVSTTSSREESGVDEISIPPVGDLDVDPDPTEPMADHFFAQASLHGHDDLDWEEGEAGKKAARKRTPEVVQRRERFSRYVKLAVAGAAVVCLAAVGRTAMTSSASASATIAPAPVVAAVAPAVEKAAPVELPKVAATVIETAAPVAAVNAPTENVNAETPAAEPAKAEAPSTAPTTATAEVTPTPTPSSSASAAAPATEPAKTSEASPASAAEEKSAARKALERSKLADAIAHGERAVELDPADGESWLILGAAYQEKGNVVDARRCYTACAKEGKRGPIGECRAMLR